MADCGREFKALRFLVEMSEAKRTRAAGAKTARAIGKQPTTIDGYASTRVPSALSVLLRKERSDRGKRLRSVYVRLAMPESTGANA
jgi:hypothetical protein